MSNKTTVLDSHTRLRKPIHEERPIKVICIGAGASGLLFAYKIQRSFENFDLTVYEKNPKISGTWYENKYPGCACDIPAHTYTWTFEPKLDWSAVYAGSDEIREYFEAFSKKHGLHKYCKLSHEVSGARWDDAKGQWDVTVKELDTGKLIYDNCHFLINACGVLNSWKWPDIAGLDKYRGKLLHTARWDTEVDLKGKHVGIIGNGSSGIQVLPAIHPIVSKVTVFIRNPTWVSPIQGFEQHVYTEAEREEFRTNPEALLKYRKTLENRINGLFPVFLENSDSQKDNAGTMKHMMKDKLQDASLEEKLIPKWGVGCRRITPGVGYLETLRSEKVKTVFGGVTHLTERGCVSADGQEHVVDAIICATGFDTSFRPRFPIIGFGGKSLADEWSQEPKGYLGIAASGFPNYLTLGGPSSPVGNGPFLSALEGQVDYMLKLINRWQTENIHSFSPKKEAVEDFIAHKDEFMKQTVWSQECHSWYKSNSASGKVTALWPGSTLHYIEALIDPRYEDWDIKYSGNRFAYLGNGSSQTEADPDGDLSYYIRNEDDGAYMSRRKQRKLTGLHRL